MMIMLNLKDRTKISMELLEMMGVSSEMKKPDLNKPAFKIFPEKAELVKLGKCTNCARDIKEEDFTDELSKKEYSISGMCQNCQSKMFR